MPELDTGFVEGRLVVDWAAREVGGGKRGGGWGPVGPGTRATFFPVGAAVVAAAVAGLATEGVERVPVVVVVVPVEVAGGAEAEVA